MEQTDSEFVSKVMFFGLTMLVFIGLYLHNNFNKNNKKQKMEKNNLFLDDFRNPNDAFNYMKLPIYNNEKWEIVRNYKEFCKWLSVNGLPDVISFDHDLNDFYKGEEFTGLNCAQFLVAYCEANELKLPEIYIHSQNPIGKQRIESYLKSYQKFKTL